MEQDTGLPPNELKYSLPLLNFLAIFFVVTTAAIGWPFPIGFPSVTISGTMPCSSKAQKKSPTRPNPVWTSSTIHKAFFFLIILKTSFKYVGGKTT